MCRWGGHSVAFDGSREIDSMEWGAVVVHDLFDPSWLVYI